MKLKFRRKQALSMVLSTALLLTQLSPALANQQVLSSSISVLSGAYDSVTVTTNKQFMNALEQGIGHIIVSDVVTIGTEAEESGRMLPVFIPAGTTIEGTSGGILNCRCPIQLEGDGVTFKNIELLFESSDALGSIPHREIFLAGYSLTLDNVSTYLKGGGGAFGPLGGYETELLPSVFAGGYKNTSIGSNAALTIRNSNSKTILQDIYMGHEEGKYQHVPYTEDVTLELDNSVTVRGGVYTDLNRSAEIFLSGNGKSLFNNVKTTNFIGNDTTTLTITNCSIFEGITDGIGTITLKENSYFMPHTNQFQTISLQDNSCLDLSEAINVTVSGDFEGGNYDASLPDNNTAGLLVLDKEGTLTIEGNVTGTTVFQTENRNFPGDPVVGRRYIIADWNEIDEESFIVTEKYDNYEMRYQAGAWSVFKLYGEDNMDIPAIGSIEISNAPLAVDLAKIKTNGADIPDKSAFCKIIWKDEEGNLIDFYDIVSDYFFYYNSLFIRTEYLEEDDEKNWGNAVIFDFSEDYPDNFYFIANEEAKTGNYTIRFYSVDTSQIGNESTIKDVKDLDQYKLAEIEVYFYDSSVDTGTLLIDEQAEVQPILEQIYTGKPICPEIEVISSSGDRLTLEEDYIVSYENNVNIGKATVKVVGIGEYSGEIIQEFSIVKSESDVLLTATMGSNGTDGKPVSVTYGDKIRFVCQAVPTNARMARTARPNTVDFYYGKVLLGTAPVDSKGQAVFVYNTTEQKIPVGTSTIHADFGGTESLNPALSDTNVSIILNKQVLAVEDIKSVTLEDFTYDGTKNTTEIRSLTLDKAEQTLFVSGKAELASAQAGTYAEAKILSWSLNEEDSIWYELPNISDSILVEPEVTIVPAKAPEQITIHSSAKPNTRKEVSILDAIPAELKNGKIDYQLGKEQFGSSISGIPTIADGILTYQTTLQNGVETIPVIVTLENHRPMTVFVVVLVTDKEEVEVHLTSPAIVYNGKPYDKWSIELQEEMPMTITYYDLIEQQSLTEAPTEAGSYSITIHVENDTEIGEETSNFEIIPKEVRIRPLDKYIRIEEEVPSFDSPKLLVDYEFELGYEPIEGEDLGAVKILYKEFPDNTKEGDYEIFIRVLEKDHKNYNIIEKEGILHIAASEEHIHQYIETIEKKATCTEDGKKIYTCSECSYFYEEEIPAIGHTITVLPAIESTCTKMGKTEGQYCPVCETILKKQVDTPKKEHSYGDWIIDIAATSTSEGEKHRVCNLCQNIETAIIPKLEEDDNKPGEENPGEDDNKPGEENPGEDDNKPGEENPGEDDNKPGEENPGEDDNKPGEDDNKPGGEGNKPGNNKPNNTIEDDDDDDSEDSEDSAIENTTTSKQEESVIIKADYKDQIRGYISLVQGIITGSGNGYAKWKQTNGSWWLEYADGTWPHGQLTSTGQQIYKWERINGAWYAFDADGYAKNGWHLDAGYQSWFYIDINSGMKTGWQFIEGKWYYFNPVSDGTRGKMYADSYTPDGWYVDKSGAWDGKPQQKK